MDSSPATQLSEPILENQAERSPLEAAVAAARADLRSALRADVNGWLLRLILGKFDAPPPLAVTAPVSADSASRDASVSWRAAALADAERIVRSVASGNPSAAQDMVWKLMSASDGLGFFPRSGRPGVAAGTRELFPVRPHMLVYEIQDDDSVAVLRIWRSPLG